jgi:hypothetical protein
LRKKYCSNKCRNNQNTKNWLKNPENKDKFLTKKRATYQANKPLTEADKNRERKRLEREEWKNKDFSKKEEN